VTLSGAGFAPRATIVITFHSAPLVVGAAVADRSGRFSVTVAVPEHAAAGEHHFDASGPAPGGGQTVLEAAIGVTVPHGRNSWVLPVVMIILTVLLAGAASVALIRVGSWTRGATG
jgi:hypothetical protein